MGLPRSLKSGWAGATPLMAIGLIAAEPHAVHAQAPAEALTATELQQLLEQRDAVISDLLRRVQELETRVNAGEAPPPPPVPDQPPAPAGATVAQDGVPPPAAPGTFEVDEEAVDRALERTLVREGALLLPVGAFEIEPNLSYSRDERNAPAITQDLFIGNTEFRRDIVDAGVTLRFGLPFDSQLDVEIPYAFTNDQFVTSVGFAEETETSNSASGLGDITLGFTKTLFRERGLLPDLVGNVSWDTMTGDEDEAIGSGFHEVGATLTAVKRVDPLVWVGSVSYTRAFEEDEIQPGDEFGISLGTVLAVSPETSLRFFLQQVFADEFEVDGDTVEGSNQVASTFEFGVSSVLSPRALLDFSAQIGVTDDAPDFVVGVSLPLRFDFPAWQ